MVVKHSKKSRKKRGNYKRSGLRRRGSGNRGGVGRAGSGKRGKQKKTKFIMEKRKKGFKSIYEDKKTINIGYLNDKVNDFLKEGIIKKEKNAFIINADSLGFEKILGRGRVDKKIIIKAESFSKKAVSKIEKAGGEAVVLKK